MGNNISQPSQKSIEELKRNLLALREANGHQESTNTTDELTSNLHALNLNSNDSSQQQPRYTQETINDLILQTLNELNTMFERTNAALKPTSSNTTTPFTSTQPIHHHHTPPLTTPRQHQPATRLNLIMDLGLALIATELEHDGLTPSFIDIDVSATLQKYGFSGGSNENGNCMDTREYLSYLWGFIEPHLLRLAAAAALETETEEAERAQLLAPKSSEADMELD